MSEKYDIIVIGGGHNGLTAATKLASKGKKVLLLEKLQTLGGICSTEEFHPGFLSNGLLTDTSLVRTQVIKELSLANYGLQSTGKRADVTILGKDGKAITISDNVDETAINISRYSEKDANAYKEYRKFTGKIRPLISDLMDNVPPDLVKLGTSDIWALAKKGLGLKRLGKETMMEFLKVAPMSVQDFLDERFETEFLKAGLSVPAITGSFTSPRSAYTTLNLLLWECLANEEIVGGPISLIQALEKAAVANGVTIKTACEVEQVLLDENRNVRGVRTTSDEYFADKVAASCTPYETFFNLLEPNQIEYSLEHSVEHFRSRGTTARLNLALKKPIQFKGAENNVVFARTGNTWLEMEKAFDAVKYNQFSKEPVLDIHFSNTNENQYVVSILAHYAPFELAGDWDEKSKNAFIKNIIDTLGQYCEELEENISGQELLTPKDLESRFSLTNGHIFHGEHAVDQLITRPFPPGMRYATPIDGLYLCGSGSHPGGGITCMPGYLAASQLLKNGK